MCDIYTDTYADVCLAASRHVYRKLDTNNRTCTSRGCWVGSFLLLSPACLLLKAKTADTKKEDTCRGGVGGGVAGSRGAHNLVHVSLFLHGCPCMVCLLLPASMHCPALADSLCGMHSSIYCQTIRTEETDNERKQQRAQNKN